MALPRKYKEKYGPKPSGGEVVTFFMFKVLGLVGVFTFFALTADIYRFIF